MTPPDKSMDAEERSRDHVTSLERGLAVLAILADHPSGLTLTEVAERAGLTRAGARRLLLTLSATGHAEQHGRRFLLTSRLLSLARTWISGFTLWSYAEPIMREVADTLNESCSAAILADQDVVYMARVAGERIISISLHVGTRLPAYCTSMGRVLLSGLPEEELEAFLARAPITARTTRTITDRGVVAERIGAARRDGYALVDEELEIGLRSIAVPVRDRAGRIVAAINVPTQSARCDVETMKRDFLPVLLSAATRIEHYFAVQ